MGIDKNILALYCLGALPVLPVKAEETHVQTLDTLVISTSVPDSADSTTLPVRVLSGDALRIKAAHSIGETLKHEPGITNGSFGPGVGQPVIRGQSGVRAQVLQNGLGSLDVSSLSPDHANSTEALWAERVEILKGPATLLYGGSAMGGVVNIMDQRIPDRMPERPLQAVVEQRYNSINAGKSSAFKLDGGGAGLAWHLDGFYRDSGNLRIPGYAIDEAAEASGHGSETHDEDEPVFNSRGRLLNSNTRALSGSAGVSWVDENGFIGISVNHLDNQYGVPPGAHTHGHEEHEEESGPESVRIDLQQTRYDLKGELKQPLDSVESLRLRLGYNDYRHTELENRETGTVFSHRGFESRLELIQKPWLWFDHGVIGMQTRNSEFSAIGEEAVVPRSDIDSVGFFTVQDIHTDSVSYEFGLRVEQQWIDPIGSQQRSHTPVSASASVLWDFDSADSVRLSFTRAQRAPSVQELFARGAHLATSSFDLGDSRLTEETAYNLELGVYIDRGWMQADFSLYKNWVENYIAQINRGRFFDAHDARFVDSCEDGDCLPVFQATQLDAEFQGFEAQITFPLLQTDYGQLTARLFGDYVRGRFSGDTSGDVPRMPPLRYGTELSWSDSDWSTQLRLTRAERQDKAGANETTTRGYMRLNATAHYRWSLGKRVGLLAFAKGNNLLDETIRNSVSFLRNQAPEGGRSAEIGVRLEF